MQNILYQKVKFYNLSIDSLQSMWYYKREVRQEDNEFTVTYE